MAFEVDFDREEDGRWIAEIETLPGVLAYGVTRGEARAKVVALRKKLLKNSLKTERLQKKSGMGAMTDNCDLDETLDSGFGVRLFRFLFELSLNVFFVFFSIRVAWDILIFFYTSMGERGTLSLVSGSIIFLVIRLAAKPNNGTRNTGTGQIFTITESYFRRNLLSIIIDFFLPILAVILTVSLDKSRQILQIIPLLIMLLSIVFAWIIDFIQFVFKSIQRKLKTGSILLSAEMCMCRKKDRSARQRTSLKLGLLNASRCLLIATLWTWLLVFHCYLHRSLLSQSVWVMTAFWCEVIIFWLLAAIWIMVLIHSIRDRRKSQVLSNL